VSSSRKALWHAPKAKKPATSETNEGPAGKLRGKITNPTMCALIKGLNLRKFKIPEENKRLFGDKMKDQGSRLR
jgi:hypothetical protein